MPNAAERSFAESLARNLSRWLSEMGVPHQVVDDEAVIEGLPALTRVAVLCYNPDLPDRELERLRSFVARGGKLMVFYSADADLAALMGMRLGSYQSSGTKPKWYGIRFEPGAPPGVPETVEQESRNIRPVYPVRPDASVIAFWVAYNGQKLQDPAWVKSDAGLWMTHILRNDGDTQAKKDMLLGLIAPYEPSVLAAVAHRSVQSAGTLGGKFDDTGSAVRAIATRSAGKANDAVVQSLLNAARLSAASMVTRLESRDYASAIQSAQATERLLTEAYARVQTPANDLFRAVWDHNGTGLYPGDWGRTARLLADSGMTDVLVNVAWGGLSHYRSGVLPASGTLKFYGDQLEKAVTAGQRHGVRVHAWKVCWKVDSAPEDFVREAREQGRLQVTDAGKTQLWLCPSHPANQALEVRAAREVVRRYAVDGYHLDYIRFPDFHSCYCEGCRSRFETVLGRRLEHWPAGVQEGALRKDFMRWRADVIAGVVREVRAAIRSDREGVRLSAAVFGKYPSCVDSVGQDWVAWLKQDTIDFVCPMNYTTDMAQFQGLLKTQAALPGAEGRIFPGLGVTAAESRLNSVQVLDQVALLRRMGMRGFALFDLNRDLESESLPALRMGATAAGE
jgi:uncharacterized lipoprotein YddW (UPF0748 family)